MTARKNFTVRFSGRKELQYGSALNYVKVQGSATRHLVAICITTASWNVASLLYLGFLLKCQEQLPSSKGTPLVSHILKFEETTKIVAVPLMYIEQNRC